ncbi:MAG: hypothetical protein QUU85_17030, partial [Candidatus Eisenbacteria bacterium]|nr:hypothetical protein [Candidatus Eisenbacteria bacterium]
MSQTRLDILRLVAAGKITPEEGERLLRSLEDLGAEAGPGPAGPAAAGTEAAGWTAACLLYTSDAA